VTRRSAATATHVAAKATEAADTLMAWLPAQPGGGERIAPAAEVGPDVVRPDPAAATSSEPTDPAGALASVHAGASDSREQCAPLRLAHTDWLHRRLRVSGPAADLASFKEAARQRRDRPVATRP
jgi:hypothetical protein